MSTTLKRGANIIIARLLKESDGVTPRPLNTLASLKVELLMSARLLATYVLGTDDELRADASVGQGHGLLLELTSEFTAEQDAGLLTERYTLIAANADFVAEPDESQHDIIEAAEVTLA